MRILLLHDYGTATGGAELQMLSLRRGLRERGHEVRLLTSRAQIVANSPLLADYNCFGTTGKLQVLSQTINPSAYWALRRALEEFQPDVVHVRMFMWQLSPLILPLLKNIPCLYQTAVYKAICPLGTKVLPDGRACSFTAGRACLQMRTGKRTQPCVPTLTCQNPRLMLLLQIIYATPLNVARISMS
ncbi:glycosyltransferase [Leptolyngbya sp. 7M]|uniref:glycosyltransferase n=1 Tax=Leptolyngbya sp. 7M TaxID=2812896 RepID=UPI001B8B08B7|nr:glycosyltransferase [Leptolyngbya sp. 7M]QYO65091.1 glycosyltransferase [Leptolyngbya sp. 7M]